MSASGPSGPLVLFWSTNVLSEFKEEHYLAGGGGGGIPKALLTAQFLFFLKNKADNMDKVFLSFFPRYNKMCFAL